MYIYIYTVYKIFINYLMKIIIFIMVSLQFHRCHSSNYTECVNCKIECKFAEKVRFAITKICQKKSIIKKFNIGMFKH